VHDGWRTLVPSKEFNGRGATLWAVKHGVPTMVMVLIDDETGKLKIIGEETSEEEVRRVFPNCAP
jgi:hypothetical protein